MNRRRFVITLLALLALLLATSGAAGQGPDSEGEAHPRGDVSIAGTVNSRIGYQGRLLEDDAPVTGSRNMVFRLYSDGTCATQVGSDIVKNGVQVTGGLFSVELDVSHWDFNGQGLWLEVEVGGTAMGCQEILPVPYALSLRPGAKIEDTASIIQLNRIFSPGPMLPTRKYGIEAEVDGSYLDWTYGVSGIAHSPSIDGRAYGLFGSATANGGTAYGVYGQSETDSVDARGVFGTAPHTGVEGHATATSGATSGVYGRTDSSSDNATGVRGYASASSGKTYGLRGQTDSSNRWAAGVYGYASDISGIASGVHGEAVSASGRGVYGAAPEMGVLGHATATSGETYGVFGRSYSPSGAGVYGTAPKYGVRRGATASSGTAYGVYGESVSTNGRGVYGRSGGSSGIGVKGENTSDGIGVEGTSDGIGVLGSTLRGIGVLGQGGNGIGVKGTAAVDDGVYGETWGSGGAAGVHGVANISGTSGNDKTYGVLGESPSSNQFGYGGYFVGYNGVYGEATNELGYAAVFSGTAQTHVLEITGGSDLSEQFDVTAANGEVTPGLVVCIDTDHPGRLLVCSKAYDRTVAGVVSGAGGIEPGMVMGQEGSPADGAYPVALTGRVYVSADASAGPIQPGDLLTTSDTAGLVMKVTDYERAQGAIIGKAMGTLDEGQGLILVLVSLQ